MSRAAAFCASWAPRRSALAARPRLALGAERGYGIAFTSFAVRLQRGRDLIRGAGPIGLPAEALVELCHSFGADGCQLDIGQLDSTKPDYLDGLKRKLGDAGLFVELAAPGRIFEDESYFADVARVARGLGAARLRVALLHGRRYEDFGTLEAWRTFADHWQRDAAAREARARASTGSRWGSRTTRTGAPTSSSS